MKGFKYYLSDLNTSHGFGLNFVLFAHIRQNSCNQSTACFGHTYSCENFAKGMKLGLRSATD